MSSRIFALPDRGLICVQMSHGDLSEQHSICASIRIDANEAEKLIQRLQEAIAQVPRVGTPADLGCEVL